MFDLGSFKKSQTAIHTIRNARRKQSVLDDARLSIAAIQNGNFSAHATCIDQALNFINHPRGFSSISGRLIDPHRFAMTRIGSEVFTQTLRVVGNQMISSIQNVPVGAIVLFKLHQVWLEVALEQFHVLNISAPEGINTLIIITHGKHRTRV